ncbi:MFS transporter [Micromonospora saelicesensis]|uniref:MFS transporter n=1 Tax=Micromonospora saelicesensis TaxID=285676 RepID=UPI003CF91E9E
MWVGILLAAFQQLVGINVVKIYSNLLWLAVAFSTSAYFTISLITVGVSTSAPVVAILVMHEVGRRMLLPAGAAVMAPALAALAICFAGTDPGEAAGLNGGAAATALIAINVFSVGFGVTWGPVMWLMLSELFDGDLRAAAVAVCTAVSWLTCAVTRAFPGLAGVGLSFAYGLYTVFAVLAFVFVLTVLPETRGRNCRDIAGQPAARTGRSRIAAGASRQCRPRAPCDACGEVSRYAGDDPPSRRLARPRASRTAKGATAIRHGCVAAAATGPCRDRGLGDRRTRHRSP